MKSIKRLMLVAATAASLLAPALPAMAQANDQFIAIPSYRVGPYGTNGQSYYGGYVDYLNYVNLKEGGVNGVKLSWEECETEYNNAKGVECYERLKGKNPITKGTAINSMATGISYALIDKSVEDKVPLLMMGYGRTDAVDGSVFPYAFPLVTTYQMQVSAIVKYLTSKNNGSLAGKKIVFLYHDSAYGKEPIVALEAEATLGKFKVVQIPVAHPGNEQGAQWLKIRQENPDYVIFWGWGVMNQTALKAAQKVGFPRDRIIGSWWAGSEEDTIPAGDAAKGYMSATWNVSGKGVPLLAVKDDRAFLRMVDAIDDIDHRTLAGAIGADDGANLVLADVERDIGQCLDAAKRERNILQIQNHATDLAAALRDSRTLLVVRCGCRRQHFFR